MRIDLCTCDFCGKVLDLQKDAHWSGYIHLYAPTMVTETISDPVTNEEVTTKGTKMMYAAPLQQRPNALHLEFCESCGHTFRSHVLEAMCNKTFKVVEENVNKSCLDCAHYNVCLHISESEDYAMAETCDEFDKEE